MMRPSLRISEDTDRRSRNGFIITLSLMVMTVPTAILFGYFGLTNGLPQLLIPAVLLISTTVFDLLPLTLINQKRTNLAMLLVLAVFLINVLVVPFVIQGLGVIIGISIVLVSLAISNLALTSNFSVPGIIFSLVFGVVAIILDLSLSSDRLQIPEIEAITQVISVIMVVPLFLVLLREFKNFSLQTKITLGILIIGGITVLALLLFGLSRANTIIASLSTKYETSVTQKTESQIINTVQAKADQLNSIFQEIMIDLQGISNYRAQLENQQAGIASSFYWDSHQKLYQFPDGQYGNFEADPASVFIPETYTATETLLSDINTSIFLDFVVPDFLETHSEVKAVYFISELGYVIQYPNTHLAQNTKPGFDPKGQSAYVIAAPNRNPDRLPRWTKAYQDTAGNGVIVTLSIPVYTDNGQFIGVVCADIEMSKIAEALSSIRIGDTDFAFLVDQGGYILAMPEEGYQIFGLEKETVPAGQTVKQALSETDLPIMQFAAQRIVISNLNIFTLRIKDVETYLAVAALDAPGYKLVILAPSNELNKEIISSREEIQEEVNSSIRNGRILLFSLFIVSIIFSLWVGQIITNPLKRLTAIVEQIAAGDLHARVDITSKDETGILANSFNTMTEKLSETLQGLENRIAERTEELENSSRINSYRASQFQAIARVSQVISSAQTLEKLLPQIAHTISEEFGFYHVGIFLLDVHKEFAILAAANSDGGKRMLERNHRLRVGEVGIVGYVTRSGKPRVALEVGQDSVYFNNPDLPDTHSEVALPLLVANEIIGALDVQSTKTNAFSEEDVSILSALADQVSIAIQNARLFQKSQEALEQAELAAAQLGEQQWSKFMARQHIQGYHFDGIAAKQLGDSHQTSPNSLAIPLILRGKQIGTLKLSTSDPKRSWDDDEIALAQATAERTALAIENARLLQEATRRASKERTIGQITSKISGLVNLENILQITLKELGNNLPDTDVAIQFLSENPGNNKRPGE